MKTTTLILTFLILTIAVSGQVQKDSMIAFVGELIELKEVPYVEPKLDSIQMITGKDTSYMVNLPAIRFDSEFKATYKVLNVVYGSYKVDTIVFTAFDHYGIPPFSKYKTVLLFVGYKNGKLYHYKYQYFDVYRTANNEWAGPGDPYRFDRDSQIRNVKAVPIKFKDPLSFDITNWTQSNINFFYPEPYFTISGNRAIAKMGNYVKQLAEVKKERLSQTFVNLGYRKVVVNRKGPAHAKLTIIFESGPQEYADIWPTKGISRDIQTITYENAVTIAETGTLPRTMSQQVLELHQLIKYLKIKGSIILVGQSKGGMLARLYAEKYGKKVAGLVLVDPIQENSMLLSPKDDTWERLREKATGKSIPEPQLKSKTGKGYDSTVNYKAEEFQKMYLGGIKKLGSLPVVILGVKNRDRPGGASAEQWPELKEDMDKRLQELTALSDNSRLIFVEPGGGLISYGNGGAVIKAVQMVIESSRSKKRL